jgi:heat shock protein HslJ
MKSGNLFPKRSVQYLDTIKGDKMKKHLLYTVLVITILLTSCILTPRGRGNSLDGTAWTLDSIGDKELLPETTMTAFFNNEEVSGSASCNHYFASYLERGNQLTIDGLGWTEMACLNPEGIMEQEQEIMGLMDSALEYQFRNSNLIIKTNTGQELVFSPLETQ